MKPEDPTIYVHMWNMQEPSELSEYLQHASGLYVTASYHYSQVTAILWNAAVSKLRDSLKLASNPYKGKKLHNSPASESDTNPLSN